MRNTRLRLLLVPLSVLVAIVATTAAAASPPTLASGTVGNTSSTFNSVRAADGNLIIELSATAAYTGTFNERTTAGVAFYVNDLNNSINFSQLPVTLDPYTAVNPPPRWPLPASILTVLAQRGIFLPRTAFTYLNLGPLRQKGVELSLDERISKTLTAFANYSWQGKPSVLEDPHPYPFEELALPPTNRFNTGFNLDGPRFLGSASVNYSDKAFWSDVLTSPYHGFTDAFTMVNGSFGMKWARGRVTTLVKATNIFNKDIQQHIFGDIIKRSVMFEVRFKLQ